VLTANVHRLRASGCIPGAFVLFGVRTCTRSYGQPRRGRDFPADRRQPSERDGIRLPSTWVVLGYDDDRLVSSLAVVDRHATADDQPLHLMGLSNVITEPAGRGRGYSRRLNAAALELMARQDPASLGMLFCADSLVSFYASLGWQPFRGSVMVSQPAGDRLWSSNCMVHTLGQQRSVAFQQVHLRGLPW